jgi:membrane associated rhomboid family serine protease
MLDAVRRGAEIVPSAEPEQPVNTPETTSTRASGPIFNAPVVVVATIALLLAIHLALELAGEDWQVWSLYAFSFVPSRFQPNAIAMIQGSQYWSLITYAFLHADWMHVGLNSLWLLIFGTPVARVLGTLRYIAIFLAGAVGGALVMLVVHWGESIITVGASASVSGLLAAAIPIMYGGWRHGPLTIPETLRNRRALLFMAMFLVVTLLSGAQGVPGFGEGPPIAWEAHLGGFAAGLIAYAFLQPARPSPSAEA